MSDFKLPHPQITGHIKEDVKSLTDTVLRLRKELEYGLYHLDSTNVPGLNSIVGDIETNSTAITQNANDISLVAADVLGNASAITTNANSITLLSSDVSGNTASITVNSDNINLKVDSDGVIAAINASTEGVQISGSKVNITGYVTFSNLTDGTTTISGNNIKTGTISSITISNALYRTAASGKRLEIQSAGTEINWYDSGGSNAATIDGQFLPGTIGIQIWDKSSDEMRLVSNGAMMLNAIGGGSLVGTWTYGGFELATTDDIGQAVFG